MPADIQELNIKVTVDGKEGIATLQLTGQQVEDLTKTVNTLGAQNSTVYSQITQELMQYNGVTDQSVQSVANWIGTQGLGTAAIQQVISQLEKESKTLGINSKAYQQNRMMVENLQKGLTLAAQQSQQFANKTALTTQQIIQQNQHFQRGKFGVNQLGFALGDASVFAVDFRMGLLGIGNNIPFIVQGMMDLQKSAKETSTTFATQFRQALMGPAGIILAVNLFLTVLNILLPMLTRTKEKTKELSKETEKYASSLKNLAVAELEIEKQKLELRQKQLEAELEATKKKVKPIGSTGQLGQPIFVLTKEEKEEIENLNLELEKTKTNLKAVNEILPESKKLLADAFEDNFKNAREVSERIEALRKEALGVSTQAERDVILARIEQLKLVRQQMMNEERNTATAQRDLQGELAVELKKGKDKELAELKQWYDERVKIAKGNTELLTQLEAARVLKEKEINDKYGSAIIDSELQIYDERIRYSELTGETNRQLIIDEIDYIENVLKQENLTLAQRNTLIEKRVSLEKQISTSGEMQAEGLAVQNDRLSTQEVLVSTLKQSWNQAGNSIATAMGRGIGFFGQANSLVQIFTQSLAAAIIQALALKAVLAVLNFIPGLGPTAEGVGASAFATGGIVTKPTFAMIGEGREPEGVFPLSKLQQFISRPANSSTNISLHITQDPVEMTADGMKIRSMLKRVERFINLKK